MNGDKLTLIGVPLHYGADRRGVEMGPSALRGAQLQARLQALGFDVRDAGDIAVPKAEEPAASGTNLKYLHEVAQVNRELCRAVDGALKEGRFPFVIGGDHSIAIGTIKGVRKHVRKLGVIWFDAHSDVNTERTTGSGNIHGMPLAVCLGYGHPNLLAVGGEENVVDPRNVVILGARSIDPGERNFLKSQGIRVFTMHEIDRFGMLQVMEETLRIVTDGTDGVHLSLDLDGMDPSEAPGVGTPVPGGLSYRESHFAMETIHERGCLVSAEIVEVNPMLDVGNKTASVAVGLVGSLFGERIL
ncbi:arginase [Cohnella suwonensis]|uniref:Arginase n=1 Tax=Cohnella suwonensis TaxID=696072 RepID=A0ABW0LW20_9BACL